MSNIQLRDFSPPVPCQDNKTYHIDPPPSLPSLLFSLTSHTLPEAFLIEHLVHSLVSQLDTQESRRIRRNSPSKRGTETREESLETTLGVHLANDAAKSDVTLGSLKAGLDGIDREDRNPHGYTSSGTSAGNSEERKLALGLSGDGILRSQTTLDVLVSSEVSSRTGAITGEGSSGAAEDGAETALAVELADDVEGTGVLGLFAGGEGLLALDLEDDFDALEGGGDEGHGDGGEEAGGGDLADGEGGVGGGCGGEVADEGLAEVVTPEGDSDFEFGVLAGSFSLTFTLSLSLSL